MKRLGKAFLLIILIAICSGCSSKENKKIDLLGIDFDTKENTVELSKYKTENPLVAMYIENYGAIVMELYPDKAPNTVNNFISLANSRFYDGLTFHRVIKGFMIQGGCPNGNGTGGPGYSIKGEFSENGYKFNDLKHTEGILSMARTNNPDSAGSQFFIMADEAPHLNDKYAAFGQVIDGLNIVKEINSVETNSNDKPLNDVVIEEIRVDTKGINYSEPEKINE